MGVNGVEYDHEALQMEVEGIGLTTTLTDVNYTAERDVDVVTDADGAPRGPDGVTRKAFQGSFSCTLAREEFDALSEATQDTGVLGRKSYSVALTYQNDGGEAKNDELTVRLTKIDLSSKEGDRTMVKLEGKQVTIPKINGADIFIPAARR